MDYTCTFEFKLFDYHVYFLRLGGMRCRGSSDGKSCPSSLICIRCIASANSSASSMPSLSSSDSFHILLSTKFGKLDFTISALAAAPVILPSIGPSRSNISSYLGLSFSTIQMWPGSNEPASTPSPRLKPNGESSMPSKAPPVSVVSSLLSSCS